MRETKLHFIGSIITFYSLFINSRNDLLIQSLLHYIFLCLIKLIYKKDLLFVNIASSFIPFHLLHLVLLINNQNLTNVTYILPYIVITINEIPLNQINSNKIYQWMSLWFKIVCSVISILNLFQVKVTDIYWIGFYCLIHLFIVLSEIFDNISQKASLFEKYMSLTTIGIILQHLLLYDNILIEDDILIIDKIKSSIIVEIGIIFTLATGMILSIIKSYLNIYFPLFYKERFLTLFIGISCIIYMIYEMSLVLNMNPILWIIEVLLMDSGLCLKVCIYWSSLIIITIPIAWICSNYFHWPQICTRKVFHFLTVIMFFPILLQTKLHNFSILSFGVAFCILVLLEYIRVYFSFFCPSVVENINYYYSKFLDNRDKGNAFILSHIYLLTGCVITFWLSCTLINNDSIYLMFLKQIISHMGWLSVGIGDSAGAIIGTLYGKNKWKESNRTVEGTIAMFFSMCIMSCLIFGFNMHVFYENNVIFMKFLLCFIISLILTSLLEAFTVENDNLLLPLFGSMILIALFSVFCPQEIIRK
jgi:dolichol kinase